MEYLLLEQELADWLGTTPDHVVVCSSGTAALHLSLEALELPRNASVLVPNFAMIACARAITLSNLLPLFVEVDPTTLNLSVRAVDHLMQRARQPPGQRYPLGGATEAVLAVHTYGRRCAMDDLHRVCTPCQLPVIEDMAELHGVPPHPLSTAACWSFYANKVVHGEEGGAVYFKDQSHATLARQLRCLGFTPAHDFRHLPRGHNYRLANLLAAPVRQSLRDLPAHLAWRRGAEAAYEAACPPAWRRPYRDVPWVYDFQIPHLTATLQGTLVHTLRDWGVPVRHAFQPLTRQPEYAGPYHDWALLSPEAPSERAAREVLYFALEPDGNPSTWFTRLAYLLPLDLQPTPPAYGPDRPAVTGP